MDAVTYAILSSEQFKPIDKCF